MGFLTVEVLRPKLATKLAEIATAASVLLRLFRCFALFGWRRPAHFAQERAVATGLEVVCEKLATRLLGEALAAREE